MADCTGLACFLFSSWPTEQLLQLLLDQVKLLDLLLFTVLSEYMCSSIEEEDVITPSSTNTTFISCEDIESVTLTTL